MTRRVLIATTAAFLLLACREETSGPTPIEHTGLGSAKPPPVPAANPEIAFSNTELWVMNRDGSNAVRVTPRGASATNPSWSPVVGGTPSSPVYRIAYDRGESAPLSLVQVTLVNGTPTGSTPTILVPDGRLPAWSPLGAEIAYISADTAIWIVEPNGDNPYQVAARDSDAIFTRVTWSGDGQQLAWIEDQENHSGNPVRTIKTARRTVPGSTTWSEDTALYVVGRTPGGLGSLTWSNTGSELLFVFADIKRIAMLHPGRTPPLDTLFQGGRPVWSPDDSQILFMTLGATSRVGLYSRSSETTTILATRSDGGRADWRRRAP